MCNSDMSVNVDQELAQALIDATYEARRMAFICDPCLENFTEGDAE